MDLFTIGIFVTVGGGSDDSNTLWATSYNGYGQFRSWRQHSEG